MSTPDKKVAYDIIIIGGGAAGLTAAMFATRRGLRTLLVTQDIGGQAATTEEIENYPGVEFIDGPKLMNRFRHQAEDFGANILFERVKKVLPSVAKEGEVPVFEVQGAESTWRCYSVILAYGLTRRHLGVPGEEELYGKGVVYTASEEADKYKDKVTAVVGGGNSAAQAVLRLAEICQKVYLIHRRDEFRAEATMMERMKKHNNIEMLLNCEVSAIAGQDTVESISCAAVKGNKKKELKVDGIFIEVGFAVKRDIVAGDIKTNIRGNIEINVDNETSIPGLFAAGDASSISHKQIVVSAGEGAKAAMTAQKYLQKMGLAKAVITDWGVVHKKK